MHPGKHPLLKDWPKRTSTNRETITAWWARWALANVGLATGGSSGFFVIDIDVKDDGEATLMALVEKHGELPATIEHRTGRGGRHLLFACPPGILLGNSTGKVGRGIDVRAERGLIVAPPSRNEGGRYSVLNDGLPLATPPEWLIDKVITASPVRAGSKRGSRQREPVESSVILDGERNVELTRIAGRMRMVGLTADSIHAALKIVNEQQCRPPLEDDEVRTIARSIGSSLALPWLVAPRQFFADESLTSNAMHVLRVLCDHADCHGVVRTVSHATLARKTALSEDAVAAAVKRLEAVQRITVHRGGYTSPARRRINVYKISRSIPTSSITGETPGKGDSRLDEIPGESGYGREAAAS